MNSNPNNPGTQPESPQTTQNFTPEAFVSASAYGPAAPRSPINFSELPTGNTRPAVFHFVTPKTIALMVVAWLVVIAAVSVFVNTKPKASLSKANVPSPAALVTPLNPEEEQKNDVSLLNDRLAEYYAKFGTYPSVSQINSEQFRAGDPSFIKIGRKTFTDPLGAKTDLATKPTKGQYHYIPVPLNCNSSNIMCASYTIGATLASGEQYNLQSPN